MDRSQAPARRRLTELDGLRGMAALSVVLYHWLMVDPGNPGAAVAGPLSAGMNWLYATPLEGLVAGQQMVLLFFVLSGMVLALPRLDGLRIAYRRYLWVRAARLYPVAWAVAAISALCLLVLPLRGHPGFASWVSAEVGPGSAPIHPLGFLALAIPFDPSRLDSPLWSLEQEIRVSLLLPLLVLMVRRLRAVPVLALAIGLILAGSMAMPAESFVWSWTPVVVGCFLIGVLIAHNRDALNQAWAKLPRGGRPLLLVAVLVSFWIPSRAGITAVPGYLLVLAPILGAGALIVAAQGGRLRVALSAPVPAWLGRISYSLYLIHLVVLRGLVLLDPWRLPALWLAPAGVAISLAAATLLQRYLEAPVLRAAKRATARRIEPAPIPVPQAELATDGALAVEAA